MLIAETAVSFSDGRPHLTVRRVRNLLDLFAVVAYELGDLACGHIDHRLCLFDPPRWAATIGLGRYDLDALWSSFGAAVTARRFNLPTSLRTGITWEDLLELGWTPEMVAQVREDLIELRDEEE